MALSALENTNSPARLGAFPWKYNPVRLVQAENAESPMAVTLSGILTLVRLVQ